jgi:hypothetical protein
MIPNGPKKLKGADSCRFMASVYRIWMLRYVDVPEQVSARLAERARSGRGRKQANKYIPVVAHVNGHREKTTLLPAGGGRYRMQFNASLRKASNADSGDVVSIALSFDKETREIAVPADLRAALKRHPKVKRAFDEAPPGYRRQILKWMDAAKSQAARNRRIEIVMDRMLERSILGPSRRSSKASEAQ